MKYKYNGYNRLFIFEDLEDLKDAKRWFKKISKFNSY